MEDFDIKYDFRDPRNLSLVTDFYELTMAQVYFNKGKKEETATFDIFYRRNPDNGGFAICAGLEEIIGYIQGLRFDDETINYLRSLDTFSEEFLDYLRHFYFSGDIYAIPEGTPVFPYEPLLRVEAPLIEAQIVETAMLLCVNHQSLIATKANRIVRAANGRAVMEFGARRAHNFDAANYGARATYIGGVGASATTSAGMMFDLPVTGTMAHSFVQSFDNEYEAFKAYAETFPDACVLLLDTYDTLNSGLKNAVKVAKDVLISGGHRLAGVRVDSGDISYLSKKIRVVLDENGLNDCKIVASNSFDEYLIKSIIEQGAKIDSFGVGENMITSKSSPVFGGVYKLSSVLHNGKYIPKIKASDNEEKITNPGKKKLYRIYDIESGKASADLIALADEDINENEDLTIYHPMKTWKFKTFHKGTFRLRELLVPIIVKGQLVYDAPTLKEISAYCKKEQSTMWEEIFRFEYPQEYYVDLTKTLLDLKLELLTDAKKEVK